MAANILFTNILASGSTVRGLIPDILYHPQLIDDVALVTDRDIEFRREPEFEPSLKLINQALASSSGRKLGRQDVARFQLHLNGGGRQGYFGELLVICTGRDRAAVLLLQLDPADQFTAAYFEAVAQALLLVLARWVSGATCERKALCSRSTLKKWVKFAGDRWGENSEVVFGLKMGMPLVGPKEADFLVQMLGAVRKIYENGENFEKDITKYFTGNYQDMSLRTLERRCADFGPGWKEMKTQFYEGRLERWLESKIGEFLASFFL